MHKIIKNKLFLVLIFLVVILVTFGTLALWKPKVNVNNNTDESYSILNKIAMLKSNGGVLAINSDEINSAIKQYIKSGIKRGNITIKSAYTEIRDGFIYLYMPSSCMGINFNISLKCLLRLEDNKIIINCNKLMVGKLPVPESIKDKKINGFVKGEIYADMGKIIIDLRNYPINLTDAYISNDAIVFKLKGLTLNNIRLNVPLSAPGIQNTTVKNNTAANKNNNTNQSKAANNTVIKYQNAVIKTEKENTLTIAKSKINKTALSVNTASSKEIISIISSVINKLAKNPNYNFKNEEAYTINKYRSLSSDEKENVKHAILSNFDLKLLLKLVTDFGL